MINNIHPTTWIMAISANLTYVWKECVQTQYASTIFQIHAIGLKTKGNFMETLELLFMHNLDIPCSKSR